MIVKRKILIKGLVQGVGFRPFVYKLATMYNLNGFVENNNTGVEIHVEGELTDVSTFILSLEKEAPIASCIEKIIVEEGKFDEINGFEISKSRSVSKEITRISPDIAVCDDCLEDIKYQPHRIYYPFTNCTHCGPRFSIVKDLPYDREKTSMNIFSMCNKCTSEYKNVEDRRFHAQPIACADCGPHYSLHFGSEKINDFYDIIKLASSWLNNGNLLAIKGIGGFHLTCDAVNRKSVKKMRALKRREGKPLAVMFRNIETAKEFVIISNIEEEWLMSWQRPIVLLNSLNKLPFEISGGLNTIGVMLPYLPIHYLLFDQLNSPAIILTSGNFSDEPIIIDNMKALNQFSSLVKGIITYNRDIVNRVDDSVGLVAGNKLRLIRRSRGFVPNPVNIGLKAEGILATGAELVNTFAIGKGNSAIISQHIGDISNPMTLQFYEESFHRFSNMFRFTPELIACDLHPDYLSTVFAGSLKLPLLRVQHHHAHIASCMAEHKLDEQVIGVSFDGTGLGTDGNIWGGEFMVSDLSGFTRKAHLEYIPMPGGDKVTKEPWRMAVANLYHYLGFQETINIRSKLFPEIPEDMYLNLLDILSKNINCPLSGSAGRLFDAVSAITGVCRFSSFHAEAPMQLEAKICSADKPPYPYRFDCGVFYFDVMFVSLVEDILNGVPVSTMAKRFHKTMVEIILDGVNSLSQETGLKKVVLSGGTFQNKYILEKTEKVLFENGYLVYSHSNIPTNDGGISLGQLAIAAKFLQGNSIER